METHARIFNKPYLHTEDQYFNKTNSRNFQNRNGEKLFISTAWGGDSSSVDLIAKHSTSNNNINDTGHAKQIQQLREENQKLREYAARMLFLVRFCKMGAPIDEDDENLCKEVSTFLGFSKMNV